MNLNRIRMGCALTALIAIMYSAISLFDSLAQVGLGAVIAGVAVLAHGLVDYLEARRDDRITRARYDTWARRDAEARWTPGVYVVNRDDEIA